MIYFKEIDGKVQFSDGTIRHDGRLIINPTHEMYIAAGWQVYEEHTTPEQAKAKVIADIEAYDTSPAVDGFMLNGTHAWLDPEVRNNYRTSIDAAQLLGEESITFRIGALEATIPLGTATLLLAQIQRYADKCYLVTENHKKNVGGLATVEEVEAYDYKQGYPDKLVFDI